LPDDGGLNASSVAAPAPGRLRRLLTSDHLAGWTFILPAVILIVVFGLIPIVWGLILSFQKAGLISPEREWVGFENYARIAGDPKARQAALNTIVYTLLFVPISILASLLIAHALNRRIALIRFYRLAVFLPVVTSTIATGIMFLWLLDKNYGLANWALGKIGIGPFGFFEDPDQAMVSLVIMTVWGWLGFDTIIYLAALQGVPPELTEAAAIDGASRWSSFWRITWPMLGPATLLLVVWSTISALQLFDEVFFVTHGGPLGRTSVVVFYVYRLAFEQGLGGLSLAGYAAAIAYVLFLVILLLTLAQFWLARRVVHYTS
jgi:multiple sugar transport system permease protein